MRSCSSTSVLERDHVWSIECRKSRSLEHMLSAMASDSHVSVWQDLPLTERLEIAEGLLEESEEQSIFKFLAVLVLFLNRDGSFKDAKCDKVASLVSRAVARLTRGHQAESTGASHTWTSWRKHVPIMLGVAILCLVVNSRL